MHELALGLDMSTQSITAVVIDIHEKRVIYEKSLDYRSEPRLKLFGLGPEYILPTRIEGEANQPVAMYFAAIDAIFEEMLEDFPRHNIDIKNVAVINTSGQQHGHALFNRDAPEYFANLRSPDVAICETLTELLTPGLSLPYARIWKTSHTVELANQFRERIGTKERLIQLSGSDAPWRFSAFGIMKTASEHPGQYRDTHIIHQISSIVPAVLCGEINIPLDFGNACGTSLMDYKGKNWSPELLEAAGATLAGGASGLSAKLPVLTSGMTLVGGIARYFVKKYGLNPRCRIGIGSGDNPQLKVLVGGSLLSLGSGFVNMVDTDGSTFDMRGYASAMYDAFDRPFMFVCRANGALSWDKVRALHGQQKYDYTAGEEALKIIPAANNNRIFLWHPISESFPVSNAFGPVRIGYKEPDFELDYVGTIESTLASMYVNSQYFMASDKVIYVAGGPIKSPGILRRIAGIWNRTVIPIENGGSALGAAVSGACSLLMMRSQNLDKVEYTAAFLRETAFVEPLAADVEAYHGRNGFLEKFKDIESQLISR